MKIIIFGIGTYFNNRKILLNDEEIIAYIDNSINEEDTVRYNNKPVINPKRIVEMEYDYIVLMSLFSKEMSEQLKCIGCPNDKILFFERYLELEYGQQYRIYKTSKQSDKQRILIIAPSALNDGATTAILNLASVISENYAVSVAASIFLEEKKKLFLEMGCDVIAFPAIYTIKYEENDWLKDFYFVIYNTSHMLSAYIELKPHIKGFLWAHDPISSLQRAIDYVDSKNNKEIIDIKDVYAVSEEAEKSYRTVLKRNVILSKLPYGLPDTCKKKNENKDKIIFAVVGAIYNGKGQDIFIKAVRMIPEKIRKRCSFLIIGAIPESSQFYCEVKKESEGIPEIEFLGEVSKSDMELLYMKIDVVVCASRIDMLPTVIVEGMMNSLLVISSNATGMAKYIINGENGFVFENENYKELSTIMSEIIVNYDSFKSLRENARNTYEDFFSIDTFRKNVFSIIG